MNTLRDTVFLDIRKEYNNKGSASFLYRYLREGKLKEKCDADPENEAKHIHKAATDLMYNLGYPLAQKIFKEFADPTLSQKEIEEKEKARQQRRERYRRQKEEKNGTPNGLPPKKDSAGKTPKEKRPRSHNTALDLMDAWYADTLRRKSSGPLALFSENEINEADYQTLFEELNKAGKTGVIIPVKIDPLSGEGLYILGKDLFPKGEFQYDGGYSCGFAIISLFQIETDKNYGASLNFSFDQYANLGAPTLVSEAIKFFDNYINEDRANSGYMDEVWSRNGEMPQSCPESLKIYFSDYEAEDDFDKLTDEDRREAKADYGSENE